MSRFITCALGLTSVALAVSTQSAALASSSSAATTYNGTWYEATAGTCAQVPVTGRWSATLKQDRTASVSVTIFMDGKLHAAWGGNSLGDTFAWTQTAEGYVLALGDVTFTIEGDQIRFDIPQRYPMCDAHVLGTVSPARTS